MRSVRISSLEIQLGSRYKLLLESSKLCDRSVLSRHVFLRRLIDAEVWTLSNRICCPLGRDCKGRISPLALSRELAQMDIINPLSLTADLGEREEACRLKQPTSPFQPLADDAFKSAWGSCWTGEAAGKRQPSAVCLELKVGKAYLGQGPGTLVFTRCDFCQFCDRRAWLCFVPVLPVLCSCFARWPKATKSACGLRARSQDLKLLQVWFTGTRCLETKTFC